MMDGGFINPNQANAVGGAGSPAGATGENTFQDLKIHQLFVLVKPASADDSFSAAESMVGGVAGAVKGVVDKVESVAANIPGMDLMIKENPKATKSKKEYLKSYAEWDTQLTTLKTSHTKLFKDTKTITFEFSAKNIDERTKEGEKLTDKIKGELSAWSGYTTWIHIIAIGQGGNIANECSIKLGADSEFQSEKWRVKSLFYVATPLYKKHHLFDKKCLKGEGKLYHVASPFDLTHQAIEYFEPSSDLLKYVTDCNGNMLSVMTAGIKMRVVNLIMILLKGLSIGTGAGVMDPIKNLVNGIKDEVSGTIEDVKGMIDKIIDDVKDIIDLKELDQVKSFIDGFDAIPDQCKKILDDELKALKKKLEDGVANREVGIGLSDLSKFFNCLCPFVDFLKTFLEKLSQDKEVQKGLANNLIKKAKIKKVFAIGRANGVEVDLGDNDPYKKIMMDAAMKKEPDKVFAWMTSIQSSMNKATAKEEEIDKMSSEQQKEVANAVALITYPMLASKKEFIDKLLHKLGDLIKIQKLMEDISLQSLASKLGDKMKALYLTFPPEKLTNSMNEFDVEFKRIKDFFNAKEFSVKEDSLYFIYEAHNLAVTKMYDAMAFELDHASSYAEVMRSKGYDNEFMISGKNTYKQVGESEVKDVIPTRELPEAETT